MLYCLVAGVTAWVMYHTYHLQKRVGLITGVSLLIFFGTRFALEFMKNPQVAEEADMTFNIGQWLSVPLILAGGVSHSHQPHPERIKVPGEGGSR